MAITDNNISALPSHTHTSTSGNGGRLSDLTMYTDDTETLAELILLGW